MMDEIKIKRADVMSCLLENRKKHEDQVKEAKENYRIELVRALAKRLNEAGTDKDVDHFFDDLTVPKSFLADYDRAIKAVSMSCEEVLTLNETEFRQLVNDEWSWRNVYAGSNAKYVRSSSIS